jgi:hypothetical protein
MRICISRGATSIILTAFIAGSIYAILALDPIFVQKTQRCIVVNTHMSRWLGRSMSAFDPPTY